MYSLQQFMNETSGTLVASRGGIKGQCVSLVQRWAEVNGVTGTPVFPVAAAKDMPNTRSDFFTYEANTPTGVPSPGDIIIWNGNWGGGYGHTGVVISANVNSFQAFEQNNPTGSGAHIVNHPNYSGVSGWLKLKAKQGVTEVATNANNIKDLYRSELGREASDAEANAWAGQPWDKAYYEIKGSPEGQARAKTVANAISAVPALQKQVADLQAQVKAQQEQIQKLSSQAPQYVEKEVVIEKEKLVGIEDMSLGQLLSAAFSKLFKIK